MTLEFILFLVSGNTNKQHKIRKTPLPCYSATASRISNEAPLHELTDVLWLVRTKFEDWVEPVSFALSAYPGCFLWGTSPEFFSCWIFNCLNLTWNVNTLIYIFFFLFFFIFFLKINSFLNFLTSNFQNITRTHFFKHYKFRFRFCWLISFHNVTSSSVAHYCNNADRCSSVAQDICHCASRQQWWPKTGRFKLCTQKNPDESNFKVDSYFLFLKNKWTLLKNTVTH